MAKYKYGVFTVTEGCEVLSNTFYSDEEDLEFDPYSDAVPLTIGSNQIVRRFQEIDVPDLIASLRYLARKCHSTQVLIPNEPRCTALKPGDHDLSNLLQYLADMIEE